MQIKAYPTYLQSLGILLILFLLALLSSLLVMPFFSLKSILGLSLVYLITFSSAVAVLLQIRHDYSFKINKFAPGLILFASITILCTHLALDPLTSLFPPPENLQALFKEVYQHPLILFAMIVIAAPLLEELLFRGIILEGLLKNYNATSAILFTSFLFALIHGNLAQGIGAFFIGLLIGWVYWKTQSVIPGIVIHFINNLAAFASILLTPEEDLLKDTQEQIGNPLYYWLLIIGSLVVAVVGVWLLHKKYLSKVVIE